MLYPNQYHNLKVGDKFTATISDIPVEGKIQIEEGFVYLCQDQQAPAGTYFYRMQYPNCNDKLGYKYSYNIGRDFSIDLYSLRRIDVYDLSTCNRKSRIEKLNI